MAENVATLVTFERRCSDEAIGILEQMLERARSGEVVAVAVAGVCMDGAITTVFSKSPNVGTFVGAVEIVKARILKTLVEL